MKDTLPATLILAAKYTPDPIGFAEALNKIAHIVNCLGGLGNEWADAFHLGPMPALNAAMIKIGDLMPGRGKT